MLYVRTINNLGHRDYYEAQLVYTNDHGVLQVLLTDGHIREINPRHFFRVDVSPVQLPLAKTCPHGYENWDDCPDCRH